MSLPAAHVAAKPSPRWEAIQHRFPSPPPAINTPDVNDTLATRVHTHICRTLEQLFASLDNATSNTMLSPVERNDQVSQAGATALGLMNELDNAYTVAGDSLSLLRRHAADAEAKAAATIVPDAAKLGYLTALMTGLAACARPDTMRALSVTVELLKDRSQSAATLASAVATAQAALMGPNYWFFSPALPEELLTSLTEALRLRLAPELHTAAMELAVLVDHCEQLRVNGFAELR
jgi:hypothetical protein